MTDKLPVIPEMHIQGNINLQEAFIPKGIVDFALQITEDGRIFICIDGIDFIKFKPIRGKV